MIEDPVDSSFGFNLACWRNYSIKCLADRLLHHHLNTLKKLTSPFADIDFRQPASLNRDVNLAELIWERTAPQILREDDWRCQLGTSKKFKIWPDSRASSDEMSSEVGIPPSKPSKNLHWGIAGWLLPVLIEVNDQPLEPGTPGLPQARQLKCWSERRSSENSGFAWGRKLKCWDLKTDWPDVIRSAEHHIFKGIPGTTK